MLVSPIKNSFASGEWGTSLLGRTDIAQYSNACAIVENFLCRPYGSAISTPGTKYIREVKDSSKKTRIIPFVFSRTDANIIEMGDEYMRFFTDSSSLLGSPMTLDYMEYSSDSLARAAYVSSSGLTDVLGQNYTGADVITNALGYGGYGAVSQSFTVSTTQLLSKVALELKIQAGSPTYNITCELQTNAAGYPSNTALATSSTILNGTSVTSSYAYYDFLFDNVTISASTIYHIVWKTSTQDSSNYFVIHTKAGGAGYTSGESYSDSGTGTDWSTPARDNGDLNFKQYYSTYNLEAFSEATIKQQGLTSLKCIAKTPSGASCTLTRTIAVPIDLSSASQFNFDIYASRTGCNISIGIHDAGGTTTSIVPTISTVNTWMTQTVDLSSVAVANKDAIDSIIITILNADADNTFYIDNMYGLFSQITSPFTEDELFDIHFAQLNDVIYLAHKDHHPQKLTRLSASSWTIDDFAFLGGPFMPDNTTAITLTPSGTLGTITLTFSATSSSVQFIPSSSPPKVPAIKTSPPTIHLISFASFEAKGRLRASSSFCELRAYSSYMKG